MQLVNIAAGAITAFQQSPQTRSAGDVQPLVWEQLAIS